MVNMSIDPVLYANILEAALANRDKWDAGEQIEARRVPHSIGGVSAEIIFAIRRVSESGEVAP